MGISGKDDLTLLLRSASRGDQAALARAAELVHEELRSIAHQVLLGQRRGQTLRTTALVNEAFVRLVGERVPRFEGQSHFFGVAAKAMRSILVDYARARSAQKRGGSWERIALDDVIDRIEVDRLDLVALEEALRRLEERAPRQAQVVELRFFAGLSIAQAAEAMGVSHGTIEQDWRFARAWLHRELAGKEGW